MGHSQLPGVRPPWVDDSLFPFESRFVELDDHVVHYVDEGSGPVLLMLHGNPTWAFVYRQVISSLRGHFRCIALDYPGFGLSVAGPGYSYLPADHAAVTGAFVERLGLSEVTLVVQDWGGPIGLRMAEQRSEAIRGLVIGNTWGWPVNGDTHFEVFSHMLGDAVGRELIKRFNLFVNLMIPAGHRRRKLSNAEMAHYRLALGTPARREASAILPRAITRSRDFLAQVETDLRTLDRLPALIVWGDADFAFREKERIRWEGLLHDRRTVVIHGAGHFLQSDAPDDFAEAISTWHEMLGAKGSTHE
jgi:haloalkane dehalogenase